LLAYSDISTAFWNKIDFALISKSDLRTTKTIRKISVAKRINYNYSYYVSNAIDIKDYYSFTLEEKYSWIEYQQEIVALGGEECFLLGLFESDFNREIADKNIFDKISSRQANVSYIFITKPKLVQIKNYFSSILIWLCLLTYYTFSL
jgi:hypothetical protein